MLAHGLRRTDRLTVIQIDLLVGARTPSICSYFTAYGATGFRDPTILVGRVVASSYLLLVLGKALLAVFDEVLEGTLCRSD